jgi:soluble lytic murein transglycosylase-like protein
MVLTIKNKVKQQGRKVMHSRLFLPLVLFFALWTIAPSIENAQTVGVVVNVPPVCIAPVMFKSNEQDLLTYISVRCKQERIPVKLVHNIIHEESRWRHRGPGEVVGTALIESPDPSYGLMQIMLPTAWEVMEDTTITKEQLMTDDILNVECGIRYLSKLKHAFHGNMYHAAIAYNRGTRNVRKSLQVGTNPDVVGYGGRVMPIAYSSQNKNVKKDLTLN